MTAEKAATIIDCTMAPPGGGKAMNDERKKALQNIKTARGQLDGIIRMIEEGRYCNEII